MNATCAQLHGNCNAPLPGAYVGLTLQLTGQRQVPQDAMYRVDCAGSESASFTVGYKSDQPMSWRIAFMKSTIQRGLLALAVATLGAAAVGTAAAQSASSAPGTAPPSGAHHGHFRHFGGGRFVGSL